MENRVFFPQSALDHWMVDGSVELQESELTVLAEGRSYKLVDAVHVVREVSETGEHRELVGRVKARAVLEQLGAEIVEGSMLLGDAAFDVELGWLGAPTKSFGEHLASEAGAAARGQRGEGQANSDEEILTRLLATTV